MPIIEPNSPNPFVDGRQSPNALMVRQGVERRMLKLGYSCLPELTLASGRRCDLICISAKGNIIIVEIKSSVEDFRVDQKWPEYQKYCDAFYFATHAGVSLGIFPGDEGLILADAYDAEIIQQPNENSISAATRKSMLLRFAKVASQRLRIASDYAEKAGIVIDYNDVE